MTQLRAVEEVGPDYFEVLEDDGGYLGDVELEPNGTWTADITCGNGPPRYGFSTRDEAVAYVVSPFGN